MTSLPPDHHDGPPIAPSAVNTAEGRATLLRWLQDPLYRFCLTMLANEHDARDATQETALRILDRLPSFKGESNLKTWAFGIAVNVCREQRRKKRPLALAGDDVRSEIDEEPEFIQKETQQQLQLLVRSLPDRQREAIVLRYFEELSITETARAMDVAEGTVKATIWQGLKQLRRKMNEDEENAQTTTRNRTQRV